MKKRILFEEIGELIVFKDSENDYHFYAMTKKVLEEKMKIAEKYDNKEANVPNEYKINVCPVKYVKAKDNYTDIYRPLSSEIIEFPINRIEWMWILMQK